ncbi:MAG: glycosyltransferase family 39 protein [Thermoplasmata archaeon]|nr:glycosyltransferase family 39 protein [Thermoplasmata archaeon]
MNRKLAIIVALSLLVNLTAFFLDIAYFHKYVGSTPYKSDCGIFIERAKTIIEGKLLYRDVATYTPPLINYLMALPVAISPSCYSLEIFFSIFNLASSLLIYYAIKKFNEKLAFYSAILYTLHPLTYVTSIGVQDEPITVFFILLSLYFLLYDKRNAASISIGVGIWVKIFPGLLLPILLMKDRSNGERFRHLAIISAISIAISSPFLLFAFNDFMKFLLFYTIGYGKVIGISPWHSIYYLYASPILKYITLFILIIGLLLIYTWIWKKKYGAWKCALLVFLIFFIFYRKIHGNYFLYIFSLLSPFYFINARTKWKYWVLTALVFLSQWLSFQEDVMYLYLSISVSLCVILILALLFLDVSSSHSEKYKNSISL